MADYARALAVTPTHLSRVVRAATGAPASRVIETRLIREARRHLVYTQASVSAVAYGLGFTDPAYFTRVFSRVVGMAPSEFSSRGRVSGRASGGRGRVSGALRMIAAA
ncbi:MAG: helix-turn-helix transcriptional regulator [Rubrivivax sp.]